MMSANGSKLGEDYLDPMIKVGFSEETLERGTA
jgi:hypothetical protein